MAQAGIYAPSAVIDADVVVRVNGVVREHVSMDWSGDTTGGLPAQVVSAGTGMRSRTGSIVWAPVDPVTIEPPHPLRQTAGWPPREGDEVVIDATVDTGQGPYTWRRFTGRLGRTTGSLTDGTLTSEVTDTLADSLDTLVTIPPLAWVEGVGAPSSWTVAYRALEASGLGHLPPVDAATIAHFSGQGEATAVVGSVTGTAPSYNDTDYGMWVRDVVLTTAAMSRDSRDVLVVARGSVRYGSWVEVRLSNDTRVRLTIDLSGGLRLVTGGVLVWSGQWADPSPVPVLAFQLTTAGIRVWTSRTTYSIVAPNVLSRTATVTHLSGDHVSGVSARYVPNSWGPAIVLAAPERPLTWAYSGAAMSAMRATRGIENSTARSVVDSWSDATLAPVWMDELGTPAMRPRDVLVNGAVARQVRIDERVFAGSWSVGDDAVRSRVEITGQQGALRFRRDGEYRFPVHEERSGRTFDAPEVVERFITAPAEEEWGPIDTTVSRAGDTFSGLAIRDSWEGARVTLAGEQTEKGWAQANGVWFQTLIERLGQRTLKITETITTMPAGATVSFKLPSPEAPTATPHAMRDMPMPLIRAAWVSSWAEYRVTGTSMGPAWAPAMEHDASWWLTPENAQAVADALSAEVTKPIPTLSGVETLWDPRRQIGDVEDWTAVDRDGDPAWVARVLVVGYSEKWDGNVPTQSVDVRVISWTDPTSGKTYADLANAYSNYAGMSGGTYQQVLDALPNTI